MPNAQPVPPHVQQAVLQLQEALRAVEGREVDLFNAPWAELEKSVVKLLGGAFQISRPDHAAIAMGLAGAFAFRLSQQAGAFWFPNRDTMEGAALGFPEALMTLSPFAATVDALSQANLSLLDEVSKDIRGAIAQAKFSVQLGAPQRLTPDLYVRLFDASFVQFVLLDPVRTQEALESTPEKLSREIREALTRTKEIPPELKAGLQSQLLSALERLSPSLSLADQASAAGRTAELMAHLFGTVQSAGIAPEEFWASMAMPLLHIGAAEKFPPLDDQELQAIRSGVDGWIVYIDAVPYTEPAAEDGVLGVFPENSLSLPHPKLEGAAPLRLIGVDKEKLASLLKKFDAAKLQEALTRFAAYAQEKAGVAPQQTGEGQKMLEACLSLLSGLKTAVESAPANAQLCIRRITEAEAQSEGVLAVLRKSLQGPRLILV